MSDVLGDVTLGADFGEIAGAAKQTVGDTRCAAGAFGNFNGAIIINRDVQDFCRAMNDDSEIIGGVEIQAMHDAEAGAQWRSDRVPRGWWLRRE